MSKVASIDQDPLKGAARTAWQDALLARAANRTQNHLLHVLFDYARGKADAFPSKEALAGRMGASTKTVARHLKAMHEAGLIAFVEDGSIKVGRRIVFPTHPHAGEVLRQFPRYVHGGQFDPDARRCMGDKNDRCTGDNLGTCMGDNLTPESSILKSQRRNEDSLNPPLLSASPAPHAPAKANRSGGEDRDREERMRFWNQAFKSWVTGGMTWKLEPCPHPGLMPLDARKALDALPRHRQPQWYKPTTPSTKAKPAPRPSISDDDDIPF